MSSRSDKKVIIQCSLSLKPKNTSWKLIFPLRWIFDRMNSFCSSRVYLYLYTKCTGRLFLMVSWFITCSKLLKSLKSVSDSNSTSTNALEAISFNSLLVFPLGQSFKRSCSNLDRSAKIFFILDELSSQFFSRIYFFAEFVEFRSWK